MDRACFSTRTLMLVLLSFFSALASQPAAAANKHENDAQSIDRHDAVPASPPEYWYVSMRFFGTTDSPDRSMYILSAYKSGSVPARIEALRPRYTDAGTFEPHSPKYGDKLSEEASLVIYEKFRAVIEAFQVDHPSSGFMDGTSVEVSVSTLDRRIAVSFHHSSYDSSRELRGLFDALNAYLPEDFELKWPAPITRRDPR
jgi:hypothetical protein